MCLFYVAVIVQRELAKRIVRRTSVNNVRKPLLSVLVVYHLRAMTLHKSWYIQSLETISYFCNKSTEPDVVKTSQYHCGA